MFPSKAAWGGTVGDLRTACPGPPDSRFDGSPPRRGQSFNRESELLGLPGGSGQEPPVYSINPLNGPRTSVISKDGKFVYLATGTGGALLVFNRNETTGDLTFAQCFRGFSDTAPAQSWSALADYVMSIISEDGKKRRRRQLGRLHAFFNFDRDKTTVYAHTQPVLRTTGNGTRCTDVDRWTTTPG